MNESTIMRKIQLALAKHGVRLFRNNVGTLQDKDGRYIKFGLCVGSSDLIGYTATGRFIAVEVKVPGKQATPEQQAFLDAVVTCGGIGFVAHSEEEAERKYNDSLTATTRIG